MKTIIIIFLMQTTFYSQNLVDLYSEYIPKNLLKNENLKSNIEVNLNFNSEIHPDLLYYYLEYLNNISKNQSDSLIMHNTKKYKFYRAKYQNYRSSWAEYQLSKIEKNIKNRLKRNSMEEYLIPLVYNSADKPLEELKTKINKNFSEYIKYLFFTKNKRPYDSTKTYFMFNNRLLREKIELFNKEFSEFNEYTFDNKILKKKNDIKFWFLLGKPNPTGINKYTDYDLYDLNINIYDNYFHTKNAWLFDISWSMFVPSSFLISKTILYSDKPLPTFIEPIRYNFSFDLKYRPFINFMLGYQFALKPELEFLSYVKLFLGYSFVIIENNDKNLEEEFYRFTYKYNSANDKLVYVYKNNKIKNIKNNFGYLRTMIPVFYFSKNFYVDFGFNISIKLLQYDYQIEKQSVRETSTSTTALFSDYNNFSFKDNNIYIEPVLSIIYDLYNSFSLSISNSILYNTYSLNVNLSYKY